LRSTGAAGSKHQCDIIGLQEIGTSSHAKQPLLHGMIHWSFAPIVNPSNCTSGVQKINIEATLTEEQAAAFAQILKRGGLTDYRSLATSEEEAYPMLAGGEAIRKSLAEAGFSPR
jgi:hypothetical protein